MDKSNNIGFTHAAGAIGAGSAINEVSDIIDMQACNGAIFIVPIADSAAGAIASLEIEQNDINSTSGMTALEDSIATKTCVADDDLNNKLLIVEIYRPLKGYLRARLKSTTANIAFGDLIVLKTGHKVAPVIQDASVANLVLAVGPTESA